MSSTALSDTQNLHALIQGRETNQVIAFLDEHPDSIFARDPNGDCALHLAFRVGHWPIIEEVHRTDGRQQDILNARGESIMHVLASENCKIKRIDRFPLFRSCLSKWKNRTLDLQDNQGWTPLHRAANDGLTDIVNSILNLESAALCIQTPKGETPLHLAIKKNHLDTVKFIIDRASRSGEITRLISSQTSSGQSLLHFSANCSFAAFHAVFECLNDRQRSYFLAKYDNNEETPLDAARNRGNTEIVRVLINAGSPTGHLRVSCDCSKATSKRFRISSSSSSSEEEDEGEEGQSPVKYTRNH